MIFPEEVGVAICPIPILEWNCVCLSQREAVSGMFSETLAEVELSEREALRRKQEVEGDRELQETYKVCDV